MLSKKFTCSLFALIASSFVLAACNKYVVATDKKIETTLERVDEYIEQAQIPDLPEPTDTVTIHNDIWLGNQSVKIMEGDPLPAVFEKEDGITIAIAEDATLADILQQVTDITGIPVRLDDLQEDAGGVPEDAVPVRYSGKLSGLLNYLSNRYSIYWQYKNRMIIFYTKETRIFTIYALPTTSTMSASLSGTSMGSSGGGGNSSSNLSVDTELDLWAKIEEGVKQVAGDAQLSVSKPSGTITVTASPHIIRKVAAYIANWNEKLSRQVAITVRLLQVDLSNEDNYGLDLTAAFKPKSGKHSLDFTSAFVEKAGAGVAMKILTGNWDLSQTIDALSSQGKTQLLYTTTATTLNNKVAPINLTTSMNYVKEITVTHSGSSDNQTTDVDRDVEELTYGLSVNVLPRILDQGRIMLLFSLSLSDLAHMGSDCSTSGGSSNKNNSSSNGNEGGDEEEGGDEQENQSNDSGEKSCVQLPEMIQTGFLQEVAMRSGNTLVLSGFDRRIDTTETKGVGKAQMGLLGGLAKNTNKRKVLVVLITPEVLQTPLSQEALMRDY